MLHITKTDVLVIGSGIAGLSLALKLAKLGTVTIVTKKESFASNTNWAQGGIAAVLSREDSTESHAEDTLSAGDGLCKSHIVQILVEEGPSRVKELVDLGVAFTKKDGQFDLGIEGGHSKKRVVHADDVTGKVIEEALLRNIRKEPNIEVLEHHIAIELITEHQKKKREKTSTCFGAYILDKQANRIITIIAKKTVLASGGAGQVYLHTTNPEIATGDGVAMAYRAGAVISNMEFVQFHPTSLYHPDAKNFLISEAMRGFGAVLRLKNGENFMKHYDKRESLAPRDIVARAIDFELKKSGETFVYLDATKLNKEKLIANFPNIYLKCLSHNIDITKDPIPVVPAAHYFCGGVQTDSNGKTNIKCLYACGEVASTGVHGANRLASNSLLEALVFSHRTYLDINKTWDKHWQHDENTFEVWDDKGTENLEEEVLISHNKLELQHVMNNYVGIVRSTLRLQRAKRRIEFLQDETETFYKKTKISAPLIELRNLIRIAWLVVESSIKRKESRGLNYIINYPVKDDKHFLTDTIMQMKA